ncbi:MAG: alpha/beta fold hydrolase [Actinomycetes bacterium]
MVKDPNASASLPAGDGQGRASSALFRSGLPFARFGHGPRPLVVFQGLTPENRADKTTAMLYRFLGKRYTVYAVNRRPGLPPGYTLGDMADDYARMVREEFGGPVDVIGVSTGGSIALHFAADHPELVRRLVIHSAAHTLNNEAKRVQLEYARLAGLGQWRAANSVLVGMMVPRTGWISRVRRPLVWAMAWVMSLKTPANASDLRVTVDAEDKLAFRGRLHEICVPTLVAGGTEDPFYSAALFRETAAGIPNARLALYDGKGHAMLGKDFQREVLNFLSEDGILRPTGTASQTP